MSSRGGFRGRVDHCGGTNPSRGRGSPATHPGVTARGGSPTMGGRGGGSPAVTAVSGRGDINPTVRGRGGISPIARGRGGTNAARGGSNPGFGATEGIRGSITATSDSANASGTTVFMNTTNKVVPTTYSTKVFSKVEPDSSGGMESFHHICFQDAFQDYSPEELRWSDYSPDLEELRKNALLPLKEELKLKLTELRPLQLKVDQLTRKTEAIGCY